MTTSRLDELERMADASYAKGEAMEKRLGYDGSKACSYTVTMCNKELKQLIGLVKQCRDVVMDINFDRRFASLKAIKEFEQGETK